MDEVVKVALISGGSAVAGGLVAGTIGLYGQLMQRNADRDARADEAVERSKARRHDRLVEAFSALVDAAAGATGLALESLRRTAYPRQIPPPSASELLRALAKPAEPTPAESVGAERGDGAILREMLRALNRVEMLSRSDEVKRTAKKYVDLIMLGLVEQSSQAAAASSFDKLLVGAQEARDSFLRAASAELTG